MRGLLVALLLLAWSSPAFGAATHVQSSSGQFAGGASAAATFTLNVTAGNTVTAWVGAATSGSGFTFSGCGNTYTTAEETTVSGFGWIKLAYDLVASGGACTVTATTDAAVFGVLIIFETMGVDTVDDSTFAHQTTPGTATDAISSGTITTTESGAMVLAFTLETSGNFGSSDVTPGTAFTGGAIDDGGVVSGAGWRVQAAAGAVAGTFTTATSATNWTTAVIAYQPTVSGGPVISGANLILTGAGR